jgi:hypothetical protein
LFHFDVVCHGRFNDQFHLEARRFHTPRKIRFLHMHRKCLGIEATYGSKDVAADSKSRRKFVNFRVQWQG